jgi:hypothetical protein
LKLQIGSYLSNITKVGREKWKVPENSNPNDPCEKFFHILKTIKDSKLVIAFDKKMVAYGTSQQDLVTDD